MRFIVDQKLPPMLCNWLAARGHEADHTEGMYLGNVSDETIADRAKRTGSIIVTRDKDFLRIVDRDQVLQLVWVRLGNCTNKALSPHSNAVGLTPRHVYCAVKGLLKSTNASARHERVKSAIGAVVR